MPKKGSKTHCHQSTRNCGCWRWSQSIKSSEFSRVCCLTERKCHDSHVIKVLSGGSLDNCSQNVVIFLMFCSKKARSISKLVKNTTFCKRWFLNRERPPKHCKLLKFDHLNLPIWRHFVGSEGFTKSVLSIERGHIIIKNLKTIQK